MISFRPSCREMVMRYLLLIFSLMILTACSSGSKPPSTGSNVAIPQPEPVLDPYHAKIETVEILKGGHFPLQYSAAVMLDFTGQCKQVREITQDFENETFKIDITTEDRPVCQTSPGLVEQIIPLETIGLNAGVYHVTVNGVSKNFELPVDNKL